MFVKKLKLFQFRNLRSGEYQFPEHVSFVVGNNGQGKSNLIEAISFLSSSRSFRTSVIRDLVAWNCDSCSAFATVEGSHGEFEIGMSYDQGKRKAFINGNKVSSMTDYVGELTTVTFAPSDMALVQGGPIFRREFMDKHLVDTNPKVLRSLLVYSKTLKHRNALLKQEVKDRSMYASLDQMLAQEAVVILREKKKLVTQLNSRANSYYQELSSKADGELQIALVTNVVDDLETYQQLLTQNFPKDAATQSTSIGPHRDDIEILLGDKTARSFASQGQTRSVVLSMKLAALDLIEEMRADSPVLLLDDIESELDRTRMEKLLAILFKKSRQVILTGTELASRELFEDQNYHVFSITNGSVN